MVSSRKRGCLGQNPKIQDLNDGTMIRGQSPCPGIVGMKTTSITVLEYTVYTQMQHVLRDLNAELTRRSIQLPQNIHGNITKIRTMVLALCDNSPGLNLSPHATILAGGPLALGAGVVIVEAALLALLATVMLLVLIQKLPVMSQEIEKLLRQLQIHMAEMLDMIKEAIEGIQDAIQRNPQGGMRCSDSVILFRSLSEQLIAKLTALRPLSHDQIGAMRWEREVLELFDKWRSALQDVMDCLASGGTT